MEDVVRVGVVGDVEINVETDWPNWQNIPLKPGVHTQ